MIADCPVCGKGFEILWPHLWAYKIGNTYYCTWKCLQQKRKGANNMSKGRDRMQIALKVIELIRIQKDPIEYLTEIGYGNPGQAYSDIREMLKKTRPDLFAQLPGDLRKWRNMYIHGIAAEIPEDAPAPIGGGKWEKLETPEGPAPTCCQPARPSGVTVPERIPDETETSCRVTALDTPIGEFHYDKRHEYIDWDWDNTTMSLNLEEWKEFRKWFPIALKRLGVEL